jgi:hypothetical protein
MLSIANPEIDRILGRRILGMKDSYAEYDVREDPPPVMFKVQGVE